MSQSVAHLRAELVRRFPTAMRSRPVAPGGLATGYHMLDTLLPGGGLPRGRIVEIVGPLSSGKLSIALGALSALTRGGELGAFIDAAGQFFAPSAKATGVDLARLLVVRPTPTCALTAVEVIAQSRAFTLVVLDAAAAVTARATAGQTARIRHVCAEGDTTLLLLTPGAGGGDHPLHQAAVLRLRAAPRRRGVSITIDKSVLAPAGTAADVRILRYASYCLHAAAQLRLASAPSGQKPRSHA
jgi:hypothetical protein